MELAGSIGDSSFLLMDISIADSWCGTYLAKQSDISFILIPSLAQNLRSPQTAGQDGKQ